MKGNCIDKFISNRLDKRIYELLNIRLKIKKRINERSNVEDYFNTGCYEKDFSDIIELREKSKELLNNCNTFLERISEQYSKLN
jgi:hypothetical protein